MNINSKDSRVRADEPMPSCPITTLFLDIDVVVLITISGAERCIGVHCRMFLC